MNYENQYKEVIKDVLDTGFIRENRTGIDCITTFNKSLKVDISNGEFPMLTGKKMYPRIFKTELKWLLQPTTDTKIFDDNRVTIWKEWTNAEGNTGKNYGYQLNNFNGQGHNQLEELINNIKSNPNSRRHVLSLWNPLQLDEMELVSCYNFFNFFVQDNFLSMHVTQRSADLFLGIPYDITLFSNLLLYVAEKTGLKAKEVHLNMIDCHIYSNHIEAVEEYLAAETFSLPTYLYNNEELTINNYKFGSQATAPVAI